MTEEETQLFEAISAPAKLAEYSEQSAKGAGEKLEEKLLADKKKWTADIRQLIERTREMRNLTECQVDMLSWRQMIVDKIVLLKSTVYKRRAHWDKYHKQKYRGYTLDYDIKLTKDEKISFIDADMAALKFQIRLIESHIEFYQDTVRTLDNLAFAIRNRIRLSEDDF
jgi:hypothetical protein